MRTIIIRERKRKTIMSSRSGSNDYIMCRVWCDGRQYTRCFNIKIYNDEGIGKMEATAAEQLSIGKPPIGWTLQYVPKGFVEATRGIVR